MRSGPRPKPSALRLIDGNKDHKKSNQGEPQPKNEIPQPPTILKGKALEEWHRQAPELHRIGLLTLIDAPALAAYCQAYSRWHDAEAALALMAAQDHTTSALMIRTANGTPIQNPIVGTARRAAMDMVRYAAEFGMTPAARSRIQAAGNGQPVASQPLALLYG